jgi:hypothetical protein
VSIDKQGAGDIADVTAALRTTRLLSTAVTPTQPHHPAPALTAGFRSDVPQAPGHGPLDGQPEASPRCTAATLTLCWARPLVGHTGAATWRVHHA